MLGTKVDTDTNGVPSALAVGDDRTGADDEDGVLFNPPYEAGGQGVVDVEASTGGYLYAWMDFNADGSFTGAGERVWNGKALTAGVNRLSFTANALAATGTPIVSRFRFTRGLVPLSCTGLAPDGEVEDHAVAIAALPGTDLGDAPDSSNSAGPPAMMTARLMGHRPRDRGGAILDHGRSGAGPTASGPVLCVFAPLRETIRARRRAWCRAQMA